eukprot:1844092-Amphidinium_carterae.1
MILEEQVPPPHEERPERLRVHFAEDLVDDGVRGTGAHRTPSTVYPSTTSLWYPTQCAQPETSAQLAKALKSLRARYPRKSRKLYLESK